MRLKPTVVCNLSYKRVGQHNNLRELAKYLQFRDGSIRRDSFLRGERYGGPELSDHVRPAYRAPRWVDQGMGESYPQIVSRAQALRGRSVLARTWVISPDPELMKHIPADQRFQALQRVTERTVELWYDDNGWGVPEYSYVLHDKINSHGMQQPHAHVITPGTIPLEPDLGRVDHLVKKPHIRDLRSVAEEAFEQEMEHVLGREQAQQILLERDQRLLDEKYPNRHRGREPLSLGRDVLTVMSLLQASSRSKKQNRRRALDLRLFQRYVRQEEYLEHIRHREELRARWQADQRAALEQARVEERDRQERIRAKREQQRSHERDVVEPRGLDLDIDL